jgi:DNA-directed RNA polymerase specialized sigma24 family protein
MLRHFELSPDEYLTLRAKVVLYLERRGCYEAEDVADEAVSRLPDAMLRADRSALAGAVLFGVARRVHLEWMRKQRRSRECAIEFHRRLSLASDPPDLDVYGEVSRLDSLDREIALRHYWRNQSLASIAGELRMRAGAVRARMCRMRKRLRLQFARTHPELAAA